MDWETARRWLEIMAKNGFDPNQPAYIVVLQRVEELERAPRCCADTIPPGCRTCRCADAAEAKLARCVEALQECQRVFDHPAFTDRAGIGDVCRAALAAAKGGE